MLIHRISNPKAGGKGKRNVRRRQMYDRVAQLFDIENPAERKGIDVGIHHFPRTVIERYCQTPPEERAGDFLDFLLPEELVKKVETWTKKFSSIHLIKIDRWVMAGRAESNHLVLFSDASSECQAATGGLAAR